MKSLVIICHVVIILLAYSSPWWLDWRLVFTGILIYYLQLLIFKGCVLSLRQFSGQPVTFHEWYLKKAGIKISPLKLRVVLNFVLPPLIFIVAFILQVGLTVRPVVRI